MTTTRSVMVCLKTPNSWHILRPVNYPKSARANVGLHNPSLCNIRKVPGILHTQKSAMSTECWMLRGLQVAACEARLLIGAGVSMRLS